MMIRRIAIGMLCIITALAVAIVYVIVMRWGITPQVPIGGV
jgi:hypothetical protein